MAVSEGREADLKASSFAGRRARRSAAETRAHVVAVAAEMFYADGIHATGVDALAARAGVAPTTLYRLFASKDDLVVAYVEHCSDRYRRVLVEASSTGTARERILSTFSAFAEDTGSGSCRGCPFLMALAEYPDPTNRVHAVAVAHKEWLRQLFHGLVRELATTTPITAPAALADQLALVAEGIYGSVQALGPSGPAAHARTLAACLIDAAAGSNASTVGQRGRAH